MRAQRKQNSALGQLDEVSQKLMGKLTGEIDAMLEKKHDGPSKEDQKKLELLQKQHQKQLVTIQKDLAKNEAELKKKDDAAQKQMSFAEIRIKKLQDELNAQKSKREEIEKAKKFDENRFF